MLRVPDATVVYLSRIHTRVPGGSPPRSTGAFPLIPPSSTVSCSPPDNTIAYLALALLTVLTTLAEAMIGVARRRAAWPVYTSMLAAPYVSMGATDS